MISAPTTYAASALRKGLSEWAVPATEDATHIRLVRRLVALAGHHATALWGSKTLRGRSAGLLRAWFVLGDEPSENGPAFDPLVGQISG